MKIYTLIMILYLIFLLPIKPNTIKLYKSPVVKIDATQESINRINKKLNIPKGSNFFDKKYRINNFEKKVKKLIENYT